MMVNVVLKSISILIETIIVLHCMEISFKTPVSMSGYLILQIAGIYIVYTAVNFEMLSYLWTIPIYIMILIYCRFQFKYSWIKTFIRVIIGFTVCGLLEAISSFVVYFILNEYGQEIVLLLASIFTLFIARLIRDMSFKFGKIGTNKKNSIWTITAFYCLIFIVLLADYYMNRDGIKLYAILVLAFIFLILIYIQNIERVQAELEKKNYELEIQEIYGSAYEELLKDIRKRQHDFKNQLGAIYSMHMVAESLEELIVMQREYANNLQLNAKHDSIVISCNNKILACYLSTRCSLCESQGISVDVDIHLDQVKCCFAIHELIELLGILIDNACENIIQNDINSKRIRVKAYEEKRGISFSVANPVHHINLPEIEKMFQYGYSSKGENRGIGLARVLELVNKHNAHIVVMPFIIEQEEWIDFTVEIL